MILPDRLGRVADNANHGTPGQYRRIRAVLDTLRLPWHVIPGDHDVEPGSVANLRSGLGAPALPYSTVVLGRRCVFLDIVSNGGGGPDFRLGAAQSRWLRDQLERSCHDAQRPVVFMHAFPGDLAEDAETIAALFAEHRVACVDTGHTHYNEVLNDGRVIYTATRSTGQIEEGPPGFSVHVVDGGAVAWRFKPIAHEGPLVLIASPADRRLCTDTVSPDQRPAPGFKVRAKVFGHDVTGVSLVIDAASPIAMSPVAGLSAVWQADTPDIDEGDHTIRVDAIDAHCRRDSDTIEVQAATIFTSEPPAVDARLGQDVHSIGAWEAHGILGSQLEPNKNGRKW